MELAENLNTETARAKPFLKWAGGKRQLLSELLPRVPENAQRYFEPFLGGGALFFELTPSSASLSDVNSELINAYRVVRDSPQELLAVLAEFSNDEQEYYRVREWDREEAFTERSELERAARVLYLNRSCFNGLYRVNSKGQFNVPFGKYKNPKFADPSTIFACSKALQGVELQVCSFEQIEAAVEKNDFVYFDPPYVPLSSTSSFTSYAQGGFGSEEQHALAALFARLSEKGAFVMLSNSSAKETKELYQDFLIEEVAATRAVNSKGDRRGPVPEIIVRNYSTLQSVV